MKPSFAFGSGKLLENILWKISNFNSHQILSVEVWPPEYLVSDLLVVRPRVQAVQVEHVSRPVLHVSIYAPGHVRPLLPGPRVVVGDGDAVPRASHHGLAPVKLLIGVEAVPQLLVRIMIIPGSYRDCS